MKGYLFTAIWGVFVWLFATIFFVFFGERVLFSPGSDEFIFSILLLIVGTGALLWGVTYVYLLFDKSDHASIKFGVMGSIIGLSLDVFSLSNHQLIFPKLNDTQMISFTIWMSLAYALYLLIPVMINEIMKKRG